MTHPAPALALPDDLTPARSKRGPKTPEGKARSRMNALKHGLRAKEFGLLPEESQAEWVEHLADVRAGLGPEDAFEEKLVTAIAGAMWQEIRADRALVETMAAIPPERPGRSHGTDLQEPAHARSLGTAIRYMTAAGMATQRAQRAFLAHRKAKAARLVLPASAVEAAECTNEFRGHSGADGPGAAPPEAKRTSDLPPSRPAPAAAVSAGARCTNEFPRTRQAEPLGGLRAEIARALAIPDGARGSAARRAAAA